MRKYWVTLEDEDFFALEEIANSKGISIGTLSKEIIIAFMREQDGCDNKRYESSVEKLIQNMKDKMDKMTSESDPFMVKDLIGESWELLTRSEKMICSKALARFVLEDSNFDIYDTRNSINYYKHI